ncbi:MAG: hypothetical protein GX620_04955 [Chloroflexi bacterium]|nr:hypothetical protein [Chloroflexota bacterium]
MALSPVVSRLARYWVFCALALVIFVIVSGVGAQAPPVNRAGVIIVHGDGSVDARCVEFEEEFITGSELLQRAGVDIVLDAYGGLGYGVCQIDGEGCAAGMDCFCQCRSSPCAYWVYSHLQPDGTWMISGVGASSWHLRHGDVDGWVWGDGSEAPPDDITLDDMCRSESVTPAVTETNETSRSAAPALLSTATLFAADGSQDGPSTDTSIDVSDDASVHRGFSETGLWSYAIFGVIMVGLVVWLIISSLRRRAV